jgi:beta-xylosidase
MLKRSGIYYLMYSGNAAFSADYGIGYATASTPVGPFKKHAGNPIAARGAGVSGPGHHAVATAPDGGLWLVYHQKASSRWGWDRYICIDRLDWDDAGELHVLPTPMRNLQRPN